MRGPVRIAVLCGALAAAGWLAASAAGQSDLYPPCAAGVPAPPPPTVVVEASRDAPSRLIAGRPFNVNFTGDDSYADSLEAAVPGTVFDDPRGGTVSVTVPTAGVASFTVRYIAANATRANACTWAHTFTLTVEEGDPVVAKLGAIEGPDARWPRGGPPKLPRRGILVSGRPLVGLQWRCTGTSSRVPLVAQLFVERRLGRSPTEASPAGRLDVPDPCAEDVVLRARPPGALLTFFGGTDVDSGDRDLTAVVSYRGGARYWLRVTQGTRVLGQSRFFVAYKGQAGRFPALYVLAPEASYVAATCNRPRRGDDLFPLGFRKWPFPACRR